jgi:DNA-binding transcriptional LysR family regulator
MTEDFNLYRLHVFRLVARSGSVTRAAGELFISQPAVSAHLKSLEQRYGESFFERTPRGMLLTPAGSALLEQANRLFALYEGLGAAVEATRGEVRGEATLAVSSTPGAFLVPRLLRGFRERYPEASAVLAVGDSAEVLAWLHDYRAHLGVSGEMGAAPELHREEVGSDELRLVAGAGDPISAVTRVGAKHLAKRTLFIREHGSSTRAGAEALLGERLREFERVVEVRDTETIKQAVVSGLGVAVLSSWATTLEEEAGLLRPVRDKRLRENRRFYLVRRKDRELTGSALALWQWLLASARQPRRG